MQFKDYIGQEILMVLPDIAPGTPQPVTIRGVEAGGVWIECPAAMQVLLGNLNQPAALASPVFFVPFHAITLAIVPGGGAVLNEKAF
jgi:hypothetical protein